MIHCVIVTGMHRSGTSVCAGFIKSLGFDIGNIGDYSDIENPKGYFENFEIVNLNNRILSHLGSSWFSLGFDNVVDFGSKNLDCFYQEASAIVAGYIQSSTQFVIKDPRISILLPFWERVFIQFENLKVSFVLMMRDPQEVALSQFNRNARNPSFFKIGKSKYFTKLLWYYYNSLFFHQNKNYQFIAVEHSCFIQNPDIQWARVAKFLGQDHTIQSVEEFKLKSFSSELYRSRLVEADSDDFIDQTYQKLIKQDVMTIDNTCIEKMKEYFSLDNICFSFDEIQPSIAELCCVISNSFELESKTIAEKESAHNEQVEKLALLLKQGRDLNNDLESGLSHAEKLYFQEKKELDKVRKQFSEAMLSLNKEVEQNNTCIEIMKKISALSSCEPSEKSLHIDNLLSNISAESPSNGNVDTELLAEFKSGLQFILHYYLNSEKEISSSRDLLKQALKVIDNECNLYAGLYDGLVEAQDLFKNELEAHKNTYQKLVKIQNEVNILKSAK